MYSERWSPGLRQADIIGPLALPLLGQEFQILGPGQSLTQPAAPRGIGKVIVDAAEVHVAVMSHDCEFNEDKRNKLLVARLQRVPGNLTKERLEALWASNDVEAQSDAGEPIAAVDNFVLDPLPGQYDSPHVANFATTTPLPMSMKGDLLDAKKAELTHEVRVLFRKKAAWFFGRRGDDIPEEDKRAPWREPGESAERDGG